MHLKLFFLQTEHEEQVWGWEGCDWAVTMRDQMLQSANTPYEMTDDPEQACDVIQRFYDRKVESARSEPRPRARGGKPG